MANAIGDRVVRTGFALVTLLGLALAGCGKPAETRSGDIAARAAGETRPNILVIEVDHQGPELGAYGDAAAQTPNIDRLAREGVRFDAAYAASGGEDAETAALLTGMHPSTIGVVQEWTGAPGWKVAPPPEVKAYPELLRDAGYDAFHIGPRPDPFGSPPSVWSDDETAKTATWPSVRIRQPFVGVIDLSTLATAPGVKPEGFWSRLAFWRTRREGNGLRVALARPAPVPAYLPDTPRTRAEISAEYARVHRLDDEVGAILRRLERAGVLDHTIVLFTAKTGPARPRAERTVYDSGVHVPLIVRWPDGRGAGSARRDLISGIDLAPAILHMAGIAPRAWMQGQDHITGAGAPNTFVFTVQNRVDGVYERVFAVRDGRYLYALNLAPYTPVLALARPGKLKDEVVAARKAGRLTRGQAEAFGDERPEAELYDLKTDPDALNDLAADEAHAGDVARLAQVLNAFAAEAPDYSTWTARDLGDLFKPGGVTPVASAPKAIVLNHVVTLRSLTPGASILCRLHETEAWHPCDRPFVPVNATPQTAGFQLEAKAVRYGFRESPVVEIPVTPPPDG
jgi:arylsulfatase A-like enzyme